MMLFSNNFGENPSTQNVTLLVQIVQIVCSKNTKPFGQYKTENQSKYILLNLCMNGVDVEWLLLVGIFY